LLTIGAFTALTSTISGLAKSHHKPVSALVSGTDSSTTETSLVLTSVGCSRF